MKKQSFLKGSAILLGMVIITKILGLMYKIPLTHILGGTGMGYFSAAFSVFTPVFSIVVSGIPSSMARLAAENYALGRYSNLRRQKRAAHLTFGLMSIAACGLIILLSEPLARIIIKEESAKYALMCVAPSIIFCTVMSVERGYYEGLRNMIPTAASEIAETIFKLVFGLGLALLTADHCSSSFETSGEFFGIICKTAEEAANASLPFIAAAAILGSSLASGAACIYILISTKIHGDGITKSMLEQDRVTDSLGYISRALLKCAMPIAFAAVITTLTGMIDMLTINPCLRKAIETDPAPFEVYFSAGMTKDEIPNFIYGSYSGLAILIFGLVPTLTAMFGKSVLPSLADAWARGDKKDFSDNLTKMLTVTSIIAIPSGLGITALAKPILQFLFSGRDIEIAASAKPLEILGIGVIFMAVSLPCLTVLQAMGKAGQSIGIMAAGGAVKLLLNILLVSNPRLNVCGAAYAETVSTGLICVLTVASVYRLADAECRWSETYIKPLYGGVMCAVTAAMVHSFMSSQQVIAFNHRIITIVSIISGGIMYVISLYLLCETPKNLIKYVFSKKNSKTP